MNLVFDIAGTSFEATRVQMRGNTIEADFAAEAGGPLADAFDAAKVISLPSLSVTYSVQGVTTDGDEGVTAVFSVNSSAGRVLH
ncbi:hypothetical protein [Celeribacter sp.]|uniref:hypothetical protein n=1 Tax=Celeribacter sp. TaxID=1890673 RepID=UPI003A935AE1